MSTVSFSILIPTYNQADFLKLALDSVIAQTDSDWEAVVVNDGSSDHTRSVLDEYAAKDERIRPFHTENGGTGAALNKALEESRGTWICWLSSDDLFEPEKLALHRKWFEINPDSHFFFTYFKLLFEQSGQLEPRHDLWGQLPDRRYQTLGLFRRNFISGITICIHRTVFEEMGGFDASLRYGQDYDRWLWFTSRYPGTFIPEWTVTNRNHAGQGSEVFPQACYYDTAKAAIRFIGANEFTQMVPLVDGTNFEEVLGGLGAALDVAKDPDAFLYWLGVHPALVFSLCDFISRSPNELCAEGLWNRLETEAALEMTRHGGAFGCLWRSAYMIARLRPSQVLRDGVTPVSIARGHYHALRAGGNGQVEPLERYFREYLGGQVPSGVEPNLHGVAVAVTIPFDGSDLEQSSLRKGAALLAAAGASVVLVEQGNAVVDYRNGVVVVSIQNCVELERVCSGLVPFDLSIGWEQGSMVPGIETLRVSMPDRGDTQLPEVEDPTCSEATVFLSRCEALGRKAPRVGLRGRIKSALKRVAVLLLGKV